MRRAVAAVAGAAVLVLAGCSSDDGGGDDTAPAPDLPTDAPALWNPCDGLDARELSTAFATTFDTRTGTADEPVCSFTPQTDGDPALDVNYQLYAGSLDDLLETFGQLNEGATTEISTPDVAAADDVRLIVDVTDDDTLAVTAFVQNGDLVQLVNALDPAPFDRARVLRGMRVVLAGLAEHADESGLSD